MKTVKLSGLFLLALGLLVAGLAFDLEAAAAEEERRDVIYTCNCGEACGCNSMSTEPGDCACGKPMKWHHVVKVEGDEALLCTCGEGCKCQIDAEDATKCACGKPVKRVDLKGSGIYFCNCGGSCRCNTVDQHPVECRCGMALKKSE